MMPLGYENKGLGDQTKIASNGWDILNEEVSLPVAVLYQAKIKKNLNWMQSFANTSRVKLAPHGKTTMAPYLFKQQINAGAWAITLATTQQVIAAALQGIKRIILANQLVGKFNFKLISDLLKDPQMDFYCVVDSVDNVRQLGKYFAKQGFGGNGKTLQLLIEIGVSGGRCGCRDRAQVIRVKDEITQHPALSLVGIEVYEGVIHGDDAEYKINKFLADVLDTTEYLIEQAAFTQSEVILTGAGSAWYDLVAAAFTKPSLNSRIVPVIRPGCYIIHDKGIYQQAQDHVLQRGGLVCDIEGELINSLEIWAYVLSVPEPGKAVIGMGKRDVAFDAGLPCPSLFYRPNTPEVKKADQQWKLVDIMDQHAFMSIPADADLQVGDMISFSTSHPCLTLDKWRNISIIDDNFIIHEVISTYF